MKQLFTAILILFLSATTQAQSSIAKIKYEQAEEAFVKNDFATTITRLDEAQKLLGSSNPKILYLRLMASKGVIRGNRYDYDFLTGVRKNAEYYLTKYSEVEGIEEKFRAVYEFSETLETLPKTKDLFEQQKVENAQKRAVWIKTRSKEVSDSLLIAYRVKKCSSVKEFEAYNLRAFIGLTTYKYPTNDITTAYMNTWKGNLSNGPLQILFNDKGLYIYSYTVLGEADSSTAKKAYQSLIDLYPGEMEKEAAIRKEITRDQNGVESGYFTLSPLATGNRGNIAFAYTYSNGKANVSISFAPQAE